MPDERTYRYDVFISYSKADEEWVLDWLLPRLKQAGLQVAIDEETFRLGAPVLEEIERSIAESRYTLAVLSPAYVADAWSDFESLLVQHQDPGARLRRLIPILLEDCDPPDRIKLIQWVDMREPEGRETQLQRVMDAVRGEAALPELRHDRIPDARRRWWELRWFALTGIAAVLTLLLVAWFVWSNRPPPPPTVMPADTYNIAVTPFQAVDASGQVVELEEAEVRAESIAAFLRSQADAITQVTNQAVTVWGPKEGLAPVAEADAQTRMEALNADVLVYGVLRQIQGHEWTLEPRFLLRGLELESGPVQAAELQGSHALGRPITYTLDNPVGEGEVNEAIAVRLEALAHLLRGFVYLSQGSDQGYRRAIEAFQDATRTEWGSAADGSGQEVLYHFLGSAYIQYLYFAENQGRPLEERRALLEDARAALDEAHRRNPNYMRTYNAQGGVRFQLARLPSLEGDFCNWDWDLLADAQGWFQDALAADPALKTDSGDVDFVANFWLGRIAFTQSVCGRADAWEEARSRYSQVIDRYEADPRANRHVAAVLAYRERANVDYFNPAHAALEPGNPLLAGVVADYHRSVDLALELGTEQGLLMAQDSMAFLLNGLCRNGQAQELGETLDQFLTYFPTAERDAVAAKVLTAARLPKECADAISTP